MEVAPAVPSKPKRRPKLEAAMTVAPGERASKTGRPLRWPVALAAAALLGLLLAGCAGPDTDPPAGQYGCERCQWTADEDPSRGHFENFLAVSPADDQHLVVAACTFDGERFQITAHTSFDQGQSWTVAGLPYGERVPVDHPLRTVNFAADPGVAIGPDGTVVVAAVGLTTVPLTQLRGNLPMQSIMFVARSDDGGRTFPADGVTVLQGSVQAYPAVQDFSDHPRIVAGDDGTFLVMWGSLDLPDPFSAARFLETQDPVLITSLEVRYSASADGRTWSAPAIAYQDTDLHYYPPSPLVLPDGSWAVMPSEYNGGDGQVYFSRSDDHGATWSWDHTPMTAVIGFGTSAAAADGRLFYSYNARPADGAEGILPMLAVAAGPGEPWTVHALTDQPTLQRTGIENMLVVDGRGVAHVLYGWKPAGAAAGEIRVASLDLEGRLTNTTLESGVADDRVFGHYMGLAGTRAGAVATWPVAHATTEGIWVSGPPLLGGVVEWDSP